jgi:hypothetical protein
MPRLILYQFAQFSALVNYHVGIQDCIAGRRRSIRGCADTAAATTGVAVVAVCTAASI